MTRSRCLQYFIVLVSLVVLFKFCMVRNTPSAGSGSRPILSTATQYTPTVPTRSMTTSVAVPHESSSDSQQEGNSELPHKPKKVTTIPSKEEAEEEEDDEDDQEGTASDDSTPAPVFKGLQEEHRQSQEFEETSHRPPWTSFPTTLETVPSCVVESKVCENTSLPELVFVVGVSGSGHHLVKDLLSKASVYEVEEFLPYLHIYEPGRDNDWSKLYYAIVEEGLLRKRLQYVVDRLTSAQRARRRGVVVVDNSFPMGKGAGMHSTGRPDLIILNKFHCDLFRLKFVVIRRHPVSSVVATVNKYRDVLTRHCNLNLLRQWRNYTYLNETTLPYMVKARILESALMYIDQQIRRLGCHQMVFVDHDRIQDEGTRKDQVQKLATFLGLNDLWIAAAMSAELRKPSEPAVAIPPLCVSCVEKTLYDFFEMRQMMWPLMAPQ